MTDRDLFERRVLMPFCIIAGALLIALIHAGVL